MSEVVTDIGKQKITLHEPRINETLGIVNLYPEAGEQPV